MSRLPSPCTVVRLLIVVCALGLAPPDLLAHFRNVLGFSTGSTTRLSIWVMQKVPCWGVATFSANILIGSCWQRYVVHWYVGARVLSWRWAYPPNPLETPLLYFYLRTQHDTYTVGVYGFTPPLAIFQYFHRGEHKFNPYRESNHGPRFEDRTL